MAEAPFLSIYYSDSEVRKQLSDLISKLKDPTPQLKEAREILLFYVDQGFETETDPDGNPWRPNTPFTRTLKRSQGRIDKILQSTGRGRASINGQIKGNRLIVGTNVPYMAKHQKDSGRKFLGVSKEARQEILEAFKIP